VILSSLDDPLATARDFEGVELSPAIHLHAEPHGGQMGYLGRGVPGLRWLDQALSHYLQQLVMTSASPDLQVLEAPGWDDPAFLSLEVEAASDFTRA